jgi:hypothetical protein
MLGNLRTHFKEKSVIKNLRKGAETVGSRLELEKEANQESFLVDRERIALTNELKQNGKVSIDAERKAVREKFQVKELLESAPTQLSERVSTNSEPTKEVQNKI